MTTWKQFKDAVESQDIRDDTTIEYIDWSDKYEPVVVGWEKNRKTIVDGREVADQLPEENHDSNAR